MNSITIMPAANPVNRANLRLLETFRITVISRKVMNTSPTNAIAMRLNRLLLGEVAALLGRRQLVFLEADFGTIVECASRNLKARWTPNRLRSYVPV
jgi:hypothetical protein